MQQTKKKMMLEHLVVHKMNTAADLKQVPSLSGLLACVATPQAQHGIVVSSHHVVSCISAAATASCHPAHSNPTSWLALFLATVDDKQPGCDGQRLNAMCE